MIIQELIILYTIKRFLIYSVIILILYLLYFVKIKYKICLLLTFWNKINLNYLKNIKIKNNLYNKHIE
jgi:hypothetical protein